ncbi:hypothetical protein EOS_33025 [Caballeronia mineralivorans PML1(12)]|uniref:Uncharacterized protein n=1 Tax=Caballeronia mineralivorans PML1(12) TaxID=908627 RepID=A0A0J1CNJ5_9BURK|nr:hypothetical protein [Caballeronia mineralivorans]KLU21966.1 hypothetical protein EOS_33025 [Caballeronia mineralivorans PML1(12)]
MNSPVGVLVGRAHHSPDDMLRALAIPVYADSLVDRQTIAWLRTESRQFRIEVPADDPAAIRWARCLSTFSYSRDARLD